MDRPDYKDYISRGKSIIDFVIALEKYINYLEAQVMSYELQKMGKNE